MTRNTKKLSIAPGLALPLDAATETFALLARRGAGKSNAMAVLAEEFHAAGIPWVGIDPKGDWWGMRSSADGKSEGIPVPVFGGLHGDVEIEATPAAGSHMADLIVDYNLTCIVDVSHFSKEKRATFLVSFFHALYDRHQADPHVRHIFMEEAHEYIPQTLGRADGALKEAASKLVLLGRSFGLGVTLASQRSARLHNDVLTQVGTLIAMQTTAPPDIKAISAWVSEQGGNKEMLATLPHLAPGEAWVWSPAFLNTFSKVVFRRRSTFDSGSTPKVSETRITPSTFAQVDLDELRDRLAASIEVAAQSDPKALRARIVQLERELAKRPSAEREVVEVEVPVEVERIVERTVVPQDVVDTLDRLIRFVEDVGSDLGSVKDRMVDGHKEMLETAKAWRNHQPTETTVAAPSARQERSRPSRPVVKPGRVRPEPDGPDETDGEVQLKAGARRLLDTMAAHYPAVLTKPQIGTLAKLKHTGGTFSTYWGILRRAGLIEEANDDGWIITDAGLDRAGVEPANPSTTEELLDMWRSSLKKGARNMLDALVEAHPYAMTKDQLGEHVELEPSGGTFSTYLGTLRRNGLIDVDGQNVSASDTLFFGARS